VSLSYVIVKYDCMRVYINGSTCCRLTACMPANIQHALYFDYSMSAVFYSVNLKHEDYSSSTILYYY